MATAASIRIVKQFNYRGATRNFSNRYHFTNDAPANSTLWTTLADAITAAEKAIFPTIGNMGATIVEAVGYEAGSEVPVFTKTYSLAGTLTVASGGPSPADAAALVRYSTASRTRKNHPLYLFNYWHGVWNLGSPNGGDTLLTAQKTAMQTYASSWITGFSDGSLNHVRCGPNGDVATGSLVETYLTHRDLPR